jgi:type II secretory pathway pseudopilin PulG
MSSHRGATLLELVVVLVATLVALGAVLPRARTIVDHAAVQNAARDARHAFAFARRRALTLGSYVAVRIDSGGRAVTVSDDGGPMATRALGAAYGVVLSASRDSMMYTPLGLGYGGANLSLVLSRGDAAETVTVSREGRVR